MAHFQLHPKSKAALFFYQISKLIWTLELATCKLNIRIDSFMFISKKFLQNHQWQVVKMKDRTKKVTFRNEMSNNNNINKGVVWETYKNSYSLFTFGKMTYRATILIWDNEYFVF